MDRKEQLSEIRDFYDKEYYSNPESAKHLETNWHYRSIAARLGSLDGRNVLDVACGAGGWLEVVKSHGAQVNGVDISTKAIDVCRKRFVSGTFEVGEAENLPFGNAQFDLVTCLGALEHFVDPVRALQEMIRVSRPQSKYLLLVPNTGFLTRRVGLYKGTQQAAIREEARSIAEWTDLFNMAGLRVADRWKDLHMLNRTWILQQGLLGVPIRFLQACALPLWPIAWQYQVYFFCERKK